MKAKVKPPIGAKFDPNDSVMKPIFTTLGELLCEGKGPRFKIMCGTAWFGKLETEGVAFNDGKVWTVKERLLSCCNFVSLGYDRRLGEFEVELVEVKS